MAERKRHYYTACGSLGETVSWESEWYTASWYIDSKVNYDLRGSTGAVNPPSSVYLNDPECLELLNSASAQGDTAVPVTLTSDVTVSATGAVVGGIVSTTVTTIMRTTFAKPSQTNTPSISTSNSRSTNQPTAIAGSSSDPSVYSTCVGSGMDYQAWGAIASLVLGIILGIALWSLWWLLRKKRSLVGVYSARNWFVERSLQTSKTTLWSSLCFPSTLRLKTAAADMVKSVFETTLASVAILAGFTTLAWATVAALALALPLFLVGMPCISLSPPKSVYVGHLGTLTDMSILRLLNALDPDLSYFQPVASDTSQRRELSSTTQPATSTARTRLILLVALFSAIIVIPSLLFLARCLRRLIAFRQRWLREICGGEDMVFMPWKKDLRYGAVTYGPTEQDVRKLAGDLKLWDDRNSADPVEADERSEQSVTIRAVFAIPDTTALRLLIGKRNEVLEQLEIAETRYIRSFKANIIQPEGASMPQSEKINDISPSKGNGAAVYRKVSTRSPNKRKTFKDTADMPYYPRSDIAYPADYVAPRNYYKITPLPTIPSEEMLTNAHGTSGSKIPARQTLGRNPTFTEEIEGRLTGTQFQEVYRQSLMPGGGLPPVGTPLEVEKGRFQLRRKHYVEKALPPPPTESPATDTFESAASHQRSSRQTLTPPQTAPSNRRSRTTVATASILRHVSPKRVSAEYPRWADNPDLATDHLLSDSNHPFAEPRPQASLQPPIRPISGVSPRDINSTYSDVREYRILLRELNDQVVDLQTTTFENMSVGKKISGFMLIGRSVTKIPGAIPIMGMAREDVNWIDLGKGEGITSNVFRLLCLCSTIVAAICMIPFIGLANSSSPGFSHYLGFLRPIARSNAVGSGIVQSIIPSIGIALIMWALERVMRGISSRVHSISKSAKELRATKAMCLSAMLLAMWLVSASAVIFAIESFVNGSQIARSLADGAVFSSWWLFCLLLTLAIGVPGGLMLRITAAYRHTKLQRKAETPRQRFRAFFPSPIALPTLAATCVFVVTLSFPLLPLFPLIGLPALLFLGLLSAASRYLATYTDCDLHGGSGGGIATRLLWCIGWGLCLQPMLLGLVLLSRHEWAIGGASLGVALAGLIVFELLVRSEDREPRLNREDRERLRSFAQQFKSHAVEPVEDDGSDAPSDMPTTVAGHRRRSNATIFELMSDLLLPSDRRRARGPLPLQTEHIDDLLDPYRANQAHPDIHENQHELPPLSLRNTQVFDIAKYQAENTMYPAELIMPVPVVWLPDDKVDIGKQEVEDLKRFHALPAMLDAVRS